MLKKIRKMLKQQEGFTLVELMIVVVILGILSGIGIQQYGAVQTRALKATHNANVRIVESAVNMMIAVSYPNFPVSGTVVATDDIADFLQAPLPTPDFDNSGATGGSVPAMFTYTIKDGVVTVTPGIVN